MPLKKRLVVGLVVVAVVAGAGLAIELIQGTKAAPQKATPAVPVTVATVMQKAVPVNLTAVGNVEPFTSVAVKARVDGQILSVAFKEGDEVKKGATLFEIDPRPFAAALQQARANKQKDQALLSRAAEQDVRYKELLEKNFISPDAYGQVRTNHEAAAATVAADEAAIETAKLSLDYCTIRSPLTGYAGRVMIQQGNLVKANDTTPLVVINQVVPINVSFSVPESELGAVRKHLTAGDLEVGAEVPNGVAPASGKLSFIDNSTDISTGTIKLKAEFPNTDKALWPGQFVNVVLTLTTQKDALVVPTTAVQNGPNGQYVFVVASDQTVALRDVKVARAEGDDSVIASGLAAGDLVVTAGQLRLAPGTRVTTAGPRNA
jgi:multidrug efflux system membrane fusion protein